MFDENEKYIRVIVSVEEDDVAHADAPYAIELTDKMDSAALEYIKKLLMANRGSRKVVINIDSNGKKQSIPVPFGVEVSPELKRQIAEIAK